MLLGGDITVSCTPVAVIRSLHIIIFIDSAEGLIIFVLGISNAFQNTILSNPEERAYLICHISTWNGSKDNDQNIH